MSDVRDAPPPRLLDRLPAQLKEPTIALLRAVGPRLLAVRRPKDLRRLAKDPIVLAAIAKDLAPVLEAAITRASVVTIPVHHRVTSHLSATVSGAAGPVAANAAELAVLFGGPPTLGVTAPTAFATSAVAVVWESYVELSVIAQKLRRAGIDDPEQIRLALLRTYVPGATDLTKAVLVRGAERLAVRLLTRISAAWLPVAGPVFGAVRSNIDVHRAHKAAEAVIAERREG
jgi:hypothetical protein